MIGKLGSLGVVLLLALAVGAATGARAQATEGVFHPAEAAILSGSDYSILSGIKLSAFGSSVICTESAFSGALGGKSNGLSLETAFGGSPSFQSCTAGGSPATIDNNSCELSFYWLETDVTENWAATTDLDCPGEAAGVEVNVYSGSSHGFQVCKLTYFEQYALEEIHFVNNAGSPDDLEANVDLELLNAAKSGLCGSEETGLARISGEFTLTAENYAAEAVDLAVEHSE